MKQNNKECVTGILLLFIVLLISGCGDSPTAGGSEIGNPVVAGVATTTSGAPIPSATVRMVPTDANPVKEQIRSRVIASTTTDNSGRYYFDDVPKGEYNIVVKKSDDNLGSIAHDIIVDEQDTLWSYDTLGEMGSILLALDQEKVDSQSWLYFEGTDLYISVDEAYELESGQWGVLLEDIPVSSDLELFYFDSDEQAILLDSMLTIIPEDTIYIQIFDARIVYHSGNSGLPQDNIFQVEVDGEGTIWALTFNTDVVRFNGSDWVVDNPAGGPDVTYLSLDSTGSILAASASLGLMTYKSGSWQQLGSTSIVPTEGMVLDSAGVLWAIDDYKLFRWEESGDRWVEEYDFGAVEPTCLEVSTNNLLWIGTSHGLVSYDGTLPVFYSAIDNLYEPYITALELSATGTLWIGTDFGVYSYDGSQFTNVDISGQLWDVVSLFEDSDGVLWCGTGWDGFLLKLESGTWEIFDIYAFELNAYIGAILSIREKDGHLLVGTELTGIVEIWNEPARVNPLRKRE